MCEVGAFAYTTPPPPSFEKVSNWFLKSMSKIVMTILARCPPPLIFFPFFQTANTMKKYFHVRCMGDYICNVLYRCAHWTRVQHVRWAQRYMHSLPGALVIFQSRSFQLSPLGGQKAVSFRPHKRRWSEIQSTALIILKYILSWDFLTCHRFWKTREIEINLKLFWTLVFPIQGF